MSLILSLSILPDNLCLLFTLHHHSPVTEKKFELAELFFFSRKNKKKTCGLVQQLILEKKLLFQT